MRCGAKKKRGKRRGKENSARKVCAGKKEYSVGNSKKQAALFGAERKNAWSDDVMDLNSFGIWNLIIIIE